MRGLVVFVEPNGRKVYYFYYSRRRRPRYYWIGRADVLKIKDVRPVALDMARRVMLDPTYDPAAERKANSSGVVTFAELYARYVAEWASREDGNRSWKNTETLVKNHVLPRWRDLAANQITRVKVRASATSARP